MERAGRAVARAAIALLAGRYAKRAVVVCGKGNNGGDGLVVARVLHREGLVVTCMSLVPVADLRGDPREHADRARRAGVRIRPFDRGALHEADVAIDAIFGTGFRGAVEGEPGQAIEAINACGAKVVAVDVPSGIDGTTGLIHGPCVDAEVTVTMGAQKLGTALPPGAIRAGRVEVADIGISVGQASAWMTERHDVRAVLPRRPLDAHKRSVGSVAILGGSAGMSGAPVLAARAAVRAGAGYATLGATGDVEHVASHLVPEVLTAVVTKEETLGPEALEAFSALTRANAVAIGPGLGRGKRQGDLVTGALESLDAPVVVDADGLNVLAGATQPLETRTAPAVVTPHPAEMGRLLDIPTSEVVSNRLTVAREAAAKFGCVVLLKGFRTVVADPAGNVVINPTGGPQLATAGTGDVLTGIVAALLASGLAPFEAAWAGAYVHGLAGDISPPDGTLAWDIAECIPQALELTRAPHLTGHIRGKLPCRL
jgi:ADP-dependent NAD(P)H-hydrate dehydratase / NAD(P)H-hydrate epimerase